MSCAPAEYSGEPTHADKFTDRITLPPSVQYVMDDGGDQRARNVSVSPIRQASRPASKTTHTAMKTVSTHAGGGGALRAPAAAPAADVHNWEEF